VSAWPPLAGERLGDAVAALAERVSEADVRAQLHALASILRNLGREAEGGEERRALSTALVAAVAAGEEEQAIEVARRLAALDRAAVRPVDWTAASGA
jgi:hypothetical protein